MANVRLLRQQNEDYNKSVARANEQVDAANATYGAARDVYQRQYDAYVAEMGRYNGQSEEVKTIARDDPDRFARMQAELPGAFLSLPTAPAAPGQVAPELNLRSAPNYGISELKEIRSPGAAPAQVVAATNKGLVATSKLAGEVATKNSAFADPDDPNNLKDRGILARTLGGQLG